MERHYDGWLVALSITVAIVAGYVALDLAGRVAVARGGSRRAWLGAGALAMGTGIWSMHFIGMLAFRLHANPGHVTIPMMYRVPELIASVLVAVLASAIALGTVGAERLPRAGHLIASGAMGSAIVGMHYIGMAGLRVPTRVAYSPPLVLLSIAIAMGASYAALWLAFRLRAQETRTGRRLRAAAALLIGAAISGMHYTGMTAARFADVQPGLELHESALLATAGLGWAVTASTAVILGLALSGTALDRAFRERLAVTQRAQMLARELETTNAELQRALIAAEGAKRDAERASQVKSELLATMSHELRTPLNAIQGHVQLLAIGVHGPLTEAQENALGRVDRAQRHLLGLINDVLNLARLESGRVEFDVRPVLLADVLRDIAPMTEPLLAAKGIAFETHLPEEQGEPAVTVCADREKLAQVLLNLLSNATKFTPAGGRVTVSIRVAETDATRAEVLVRDTGIGIPSDQLARVFEPFVQLNREMWVGSQQGTGLGLAISRDLARGMGGELDVTSTPGEGATFRVTLQRG